MKTLADILSRDADNAVITAGSCLRDALKEIDAKKLGAACITADEKLIGIITDGDIRRLLLITQDSLPELFMKSVDTFMNRDPVRINQKESLESCLGLLKKHRFWVLPVADDEDRLVGMIQLHNLLAALEGSS